MFADVILPLTLSQTLTYRVPALLETQVQCGSRVIVPLGKRKFYTGIVAHLHDDAPTAAFELKEICEMVDAAPLVCQAQLKLWHWVANYYLCTVGEVMKAALPAGLKLESEMRLLREDNFDAADELTAVEEATWRATAAKEGVALDTIRQRVGLGATAAVRRLIEKGALRVEEKMLRAFKPRTETRVRLTKAYHSEQALNALLPSLARAKKQEDLLLHFLDLAGIAAPAASLMPLAKEVGKAQLLTAAYSEAAFQALRQKGILETYAVEVGRLKHLKALPDALNRPLSAAQAVAKAEIGRAFESKPTCLLHGVTSSGKTEVYISLIKEALAKGKQVLYLLPEIALTTQIMQRLGRVFGDRMGVYHSKFPDAERVELYQRQLSPSPFPLVLGVRSAVFLPFQNLGLVIVDEEHEASYKQQDPAPRYHARDLALVLAQLSGAKVLLGTATPSIESYQNATNGKYALVPLTSRYADQLLPEIVVEDMKELRRKKQMKTPFAPRLIEEMQAAFAQGEQVILFQNRRGFSPVIECRECGWVPRCNQCDVSLTYHLQQAKLACHYCGLHYNLPTQCPKCGSTKLHDVGMGTEKVEAAVQSLFPSIRTARMDLDTTRSRTAYDDLIADFAKGHTQVLIGTQMITKGLDFDKVRVVGILSADQLLNRPDFRAYERAYQMMQQVAGRAGRKGRRGLVILQTRQADLPVVQQIVQGDYQALLKDQLEEREAFVYPPFVRLIEIFIKHRDEAVAAHAAQFFAQQLAPFFSPTELLGPDRPLVARIQMQYIRKLLLKLRPTLTPSSIRLTLLAVRQLTLSQAAFKSCTIFFNVDPL